MDDALYRKLVGYVERGGTLMLAASHLTVQDAPNGGFEPYNGGDWTRLAGVRLVRDRAWRMEHGVKFLRNPGPGWKFQPLTGICDPEFIDGGFEVASVEMAGAETVAVESGRFVEEDIAKCRGVLFVNKVGKGRVLLLASLDPPGASGVARLYSFLLAKAMEAVGSTVWPKVECSDTVRWSVYPDGTIYLLNTEANLAQEVMLERSEGAKRMKLRLEPGEMISVGAAAAGH